ncbi:hypothetical protein Tsubulata_050521 [Turnera subulata]|uniref:Uncharacterized protein n=1 Tax=Turnera subulata TaxID=218843 RepID=A0A9Q0F7N9_9ROSI|nr:hypothetical protein Tsubulata_050521 [Turnera subulata]
MHDVRRSHHSGQWSDALLGLNPAAQRLQGGLISSCFPSSSPSQAPMRILQRKW